MDGKTIGESKVCKTFAGGFDSHPVLQFWIGGREAEGITLER